MLENQVYVCGKNIGMCVNYKFVECTDFWSMKKGLIDDEVLRVGITLGKVESTRNWNKNRYREVGTG